MGNKSSSANISSDSENDHNISKIHHISNCINNNTVHNTNNNTKEKTSRVLFFLHRTWAIILTSRARSRISPTTDNSDSVSDFTSQYSQYSFCSCSQCQRDDGFSSGCYSDFFDTGSSMAPNSEDASKNQLARFDEATCKDKQRPPIYNPEDYAIMLKKWGRKSAGGMGMISLYATSSISDIECNRPNSHSFRDYRNPMLTSSGSEMTLRQFGTVSELLAKLKCDLRLAYPSFIQEFVADPLDGVTLLLDLLRAIQLSQSNNMGSQPGSNNTTGKMPPSLQRRALLDELSCLQCLLSCCVRYTDSVRKLIGSSAGLFTLAICIMSNVNKSRIIALQLLSKACEPSIGGHTTVSEAMSTLRLRFGEPVRFRFLVGMLISAGGQKELVTSGMRFLNRFLDSAASTQKKLYIQAELEQAGLDVPAIKKNIGATPAAEQAIEELEYWEENLINVESLKQRLSDVERDNQCLREKMKTLERKVQILQEEKGILVSLEQCLKERCTELQSEVISLKSDKNGKDSPITRVIDPTPNEDEGISSSERSLTPDDANIRHQRPYQGFNVHSQTVSITNNKIEDNEEETTIDEVIEELQNIINDVESEDYAKEQLLLKKQQEEQRKIEEAQVNSKLHLRKIELDDYVLNSEHEIIPSNLQPQPPRKAKSLVHLFIPTEDYYYCNKELFFENETPYTSEEGSDSLLSSSKCHLTRNNKNILPQICSGNKDAVVTSTSNNVVNVTCLNNNETTHRPTRTYDRNVKRKTSSKVGSASKNKLEQKNSFDSSYYYSTPINDFIHNNKNSLNRKRVDKPRCKSLERINSGLDSMIDIVVTNQSIANSFQIRTKSDSGNVSATTLSRSVSNVFCHNKFTDSHVNNKESHINRKLSTHSEEKQRMFLPVNCNVNNNNNNNSGNNYKDSSEIPYYFPRVQENIRSNNTSFLIKRGHTNAGLYSGQVAKNDSNGNSCNSNSFMKTRDFVLSNGNKGCGKVTDLPSGLY